LRGTDPVIATAMMIGFMASILAWSEVEKDRLPLALKVDVENVDDVAVAA
jgi:hypothetical protein